MCLNKDEPLSFTRRKMVSGLPLKNVIGLVTRGNFERFRTYKNGE